MSDPATQPYAKCLDCEETFADRPAMNKHLSDTFHNGPKGHRGWVVNPTADEIRQTRILSVVEDAISDSMDKFDRLVEHGQATAEQIEQVLQRHHSDFGDAWREYLDED